MHLEIEKEYKNPLMERTEIDFSISGIEITPSRKEVTKKIAALKNAKEELVVIEFLKQPFGKHSVNGRARIYNSIWKAFSEWQSEDLQFKREA